eukprot:GHRR01031444.1.p1 GENE.GHRR01031444.1~~GHRR01031444.1.p1  ORF type:complete len:113 (-),score=13.51 GHRR01031444.1:237-575(-)
MAGFQMASTGGSSCIGHHSCHQIAGHGMLTEHTQTRSALLASTQLPAVIRLQQDTCCRLSKAGAVYGLSMLSNAMQDLNCHLPLLTRGYCVMCAVAWHILSSLLAFAAGQYN